MADVEGIVIAVQENGTAAVIQNLQLLGTTATQAGAKVVSAFQRLTASQEEILAQDKLMAQASANSRINIDSFATALGKLSTEQLISAANSEKVTLAIRNFTVQAAAAGTATTAAATATTQAAATAAAAATSIGAASSGLTALTRALGLGMTATAVAAGGATGALNQHATAARSATGALSGMGGVIRTLGFGIAAADIIKASDNFQVLKNQMSLAGVSAANFDGQLSQLVEIANRTQAPLNSVVKLFASFSMALKDTSISAADITAAVSVVGDALYASGVSGGTASRVIKDFSEAINQGQLNGRLFNAIMQQSPLLLRAMAKGLDETNEAFAKNAKASHESGKSTVQSLVEGDLARTEHIKTLQKELTAEQAKTQHDRLAEGALHDQTISVQRLSEVQGALTRATQAQQRAQATVTADITRETRLRDQLSLATRENQAALDKAAAHAKAAVAGLNAEEMVAALVKVRREFDTLAATMSGTVSGAFTVFNNNLEVFVGESNSANVAQHLLRDAILGVANNLNTIIPLIALFAAAWGAVKARAIINDVFFALADLVKGVGIATTALAAFVGSPVGLGLLAVVTLLGAIIAYSGGWDKFINGVHDKIVGLFPAFDTWIDKLKRVLGLMAEAAGQAINPATNPANSARLDPYSFPDPPAQTVDNTYSANTGLTGFHDLPPSNRGFRDGGSLTVPGAGAPDSVIAHVRVSPGERVTFETPAQQIANDNKMPGFANGGFLRLQSGGIGTTQGLSGVSTQFESASSQSIAGFQAAAALSAASGNTTPAATVAQQIADAMSISDDVPPRFTRTISAADYLRGVATATQYINSQIQHGLSKGQSVDAYYNGLTEKDVLAGPVDWEGTGKIQSDYDMWEGILDMFKYAVGYAQYAGFSGIKYADAIRNTSMLENEGALTWSSLKLAREKAANNNWTIPRPGLSGVTYARDGVDFTVPGSGPPDSRFLFVSPGEHVKVDTPSQQRKTQSGTSARSNSFNVTYNIQTNDVNSFRPSQRQEDQKLATRLSRIKTS